MDLLGEILLSVKIDAHSVGVFHAPEHWGFSMSRTDPSLAIAYCVTGAPCWLLREGQAPRLLRPGDSVLVMHGSPVGLASAAEVELVPFVDFWRQQGLPELNAGSRRTAPIHFGFDGPDRKPRLLTIAYILREPRRNPLLADLPECLYLPGSGGGLLPWLPPILGMLGEEALTHNPGYLATATHLAELVLTSFLRAYTLSHPDEHMGWLRGLMDARIGRALAAIHAEPDQSWTIPGLAAEAGMSRAAFARRFKELVGCPPGDYLTSWRMQTAARLIVERRHAVAAVVEKVGYLSETAFRKAFRAHFGMSPLQYAKEEVRRNIAGA